MSSLQISIIVLGLLAILGVVAYNYWQEKKAQQRIKEQFPASEHDALMSGFHAINPNAEAVEPVIHLGDDVAESIVKKHDDESPDPLCEMVFDIAFQMPVLGSHLISHLQPLRLAGQKTIRYFAETSDGFHRARIQPNEMYSSIQMAVLLANRSGALQPEEWARAVVYTDNIAHAFDGVIESPDKEESLARAVKLDELCAGLEAQVGVKLMLGGTQPVKAILTIAQRLGYVEYGQGHVWKHENGKPLFLLLLGGELSSMVHSAGVDYVELLIDVPNSQQIDKPFSHLVKCAYELAKALNATVVDDQGNPLSQDNRAIAVIDEQLAQVYDNLSSSGFTAGSERAARLFS
ncbi:hypothetical protein F9B74_07245 [Pelistega sp. NLN82]|uniref:Cell division protein ZipA n=1 Tax=Pelistega ratti TaxID=2652177 RepID=A0A6L9Y714_9BURK|nr:cell division protein ZipA C-terminal FtsZ-binding domain-containing protein [Pelistega ratti]NEN76116.1 hypothetical protein [Pelistega ratti]